MNDIYFINNIKDIASRTNWLDAAISFYSLLRHKMKHTTYVMMCPKRDIICFALSESTWSQPPEKLAST